MTDLSQPFEIQRNLIAGLLALLVFAIIWVGRDDATRDEQVNRVKK